MGSQLSAVFQGIFVVVNVVSYDRCLQCAQVLVGQDPRLVCRLEAASGAWHGGAVDTAFAAFLTAFGAGDTACLEPGMVDTAYGAYLRAFGAGDTAFVGAWHGGPSLWSRTATLGASLPKTCAQLIALVRCL